MFYRKYHVFRNLAEKGFRNTHHTNNIVVFFVVVKGKQKSPKRATSRSRSQPPTPGGREKVTQIKVCIANKQMHDKNKDQQGDQNAKRTEKHIDKEQGKTNMKRLVV